MLPIPGYINTIFICTALLTLIWAIVGLWQSPNPTTKKSANAAALLLLMWCIFQSTLALNKWYIDRTSTPPHITFALAGPLLVFLTLMLVPFTRKILAGISLFHLTAIHVVRIPVEITLWLLFLHAQVPVSMTFEGFNFDILIGITAILMTYLVYKQKAKKNMLIAWNILGLLFLGIIVSTAIGAAPTSVQWRDFSHPNYGVIHFPFIWLPSFVVPLVLFAHVLSIWKLMRSST